MKDSTDKVILKPILTIKPELYIPAIYITMFLLVSFSLLILPGIIKNGSYITLTSSPSNASVYINDIRVGSTPLNIYVDKGHKDIIFKKQNFSNYSFNMDIKGKVLFSLFNKRKITSHINLKSSNGLKILENSFKEASEWSLINNMDINSRYRIPPLISSSIIDYHYSIDFNEETLNEYLNSSFKLITGEYILSDFIRGLIIAKSDNRLPSISSIKKSALYINNFIENHPNSPLLLYNKIIKDPEINMNDTYYKKLYDKHRILLNKNATTFDDPENDIIFNGLRFKNIPKSKITPIDVNFIHNIEQESFFILEEMISKDNYLKFIEENPYWKKDNGKVLIKDGLADKFYMEFSNNEVYITNISYYSAVAWCKWANYYYDIPEGWKIDLPSENMWFSALQFGVMKNIEAWQWTSQGFFLYDHFLTDPIGKPLKTFTQITPRVVVGKNKYNTKAESGRGVQNADWCTPFIGFRPVLIKE